MDPRPTRRTSSGLSTDMVELALTEMVFRRESSETLDDAECRKMDWIRAVVGDNFDSIYMC